MAPQARNRNLPPPPPWIVEKVPKPEPTPEERIRGEEKEKILRGKIREEMAPKPTLEERITSTNKRMDQQRTKLDAIRKKIENNKEMYDGEPGKLTEESLRAWKRRLTEGKIKYDRDNRLLVKLNQEKIGARPSAGQHAEKAGPPKPAGMGQPSEPALADIDVSMRGEGTVIHDKLTDKYYKVIDGKLVPLMRSEPKGL